MNFNFTPQEAGLILAALELAQQTSEAGARNGVPGGAAQAERARALIAKIYDQAMGASANQVPA